MFRKNVSLHLQGVKTQGARNGGAGTNKCYAVPSSLMLSSLELEATCSSEMTVPTNPQRRIPQDGILRSCCRKNLKYYVALACWALYRRLNEFLVRY
jgi:hypothetical protein